MMIFLKFDDDDDDDDDEFATVTRVLPSHRRLTESRRSRPT